MSTNSQPKLQFEGVNFPIVNFNAQEYYDGESEIELNVTPKVFYPDADANDFDIIMEVELFCEDTFSLNVVAIGEFIFGEEINEELKNSFINVNAPAIMFPYVRSFITMLTSNAGDTIGTITIPTQSFDGELEEYEP